LARVAFAVEARHRLQGAASDPKEQRARKTPAPGAADISVDHWKLLRRRGDPRNEVLDLRNEAISQLRIAGGTPPRASISSARAARLKTTDGTLSAAVGARR
jgi:hypothetical protein